jgi:hypothetical protein
VLKVQAHFILEEFQMKFAKIASLSLAVATLGTVAMPSFAGGVRNDIGTRSLSEVSVTRSDLRLDSTEVVNGVTRDIIKLNGTLPDGTNLEKLVYTDLTSNKVTKVSGGIWETTTANVYEHGFFAGNSY